MVKVIKIGEEEEEPEVVEEVKINAPIPDEEPVTTELDDYKIKQKFVKKVYYSIILLIYLIICYFMTLYYFLAMGEEYSLSLLIAFVLLIAIIFPVAIFSLGFLPGGILIGPMVASTYGLMSLMSRFIIKILGLDMELIFPELVGHVGVVRNPNALNKYTTYPLSVEIEKAGLYGNSFWHGNKIAGRSSEGEIPVGTSVKVIKADYWSLSSLLRNSPVLHVVPQDTEDQSRKSEEEVVEPMETPQEEIESKGWSEIIADQFSYVTWIKGLKIYLAGIGILGLIVFLADENLACGTIGFILLVISYSLNAQESKYSLNAQESKPFLEAEKEEFYAEKKSGSTGDSWRGLVGSFLLVIAWGYLLWKSTTGGYTKDVSAYTREPDAWCYAMTWCAIPEFILPALIFVTIPLTGLVYWLRGTFFRNMRARMYARETIRFTYAFIYFLIFFVLLNSFFGWHAPVLTAFDVTIMGVFFLASSFITVLPKFKPTKDDTKDVEFVTFFIVFTIINYTFFMLVARQFTLSSQYKESSFEFAVITFFVVLIILFLSYNYILELVRQYLTTKIEDSYDLYKKEKNIGSLLYIGVMSLIIASVPNGILFIILLLVSLFVVSHLKTRITGSSEWETSLGNLTKYEFSLFAFNIVILLTAIYLVHDSIGENSDDDYSYDPYQDRDCTDEKIGPDVDLRSADLRGFELDRCDLTNRDISNSDLRGARLLGTDFSESDLSGSDLSENNLEYSMVSTYFYGSNLSGANFENSRIAYLVGVDSSYTNFNSSDMRYCDFSNANSSYANLVNADLTACSLQNSTFFKADFSNAYLSYDKEQFQNMQKYDSDQNMSVAYGVDWTWQIVKMDLSTNLTSTNLSYSYLSGADLSYADLTGADLSYAYLTGANLTNVTLSQADLTGVIWYYTICPDGTNSGESGSCSAT